MYFAALRPKEAVNLRVGDLNLPPSGWGEIHLDRATPHAGRTWTDSCKQHDERQLKHRAQGESRIVPCPSDLVAMLRRHLQRFGTDREKRVFTGERGGQVATITYERVWRRARQAALTREV
jgi:integrase